MTLFTALQLSAQLIVMPVAHDVKKSFTTANARILADSGAILLPFWDDFSFSTGSPSTDLWMAESDVFINAGMGINAPTINVATFDGSTRLGFPYSTTSNTAQITDVLVSRTIDLTDKEESDNIVMSFYWQMQGNGYLPEGEDNLSLFFSDSDSVWHEVWAKAGDSTNLGDDFKKSDPIKLKSQYLHDKFQFKFESFGNTGGAFDTWHIDYVYLNQNRPLTNESIDDHAVASVPTSIFKPYSMIPRSQLNAFPDTIFSDITFALSSFEDAINNVSYTYNLVNLGEVIDGIQQVDTVYKLPITNGAPLVKSNPRKTYTIPALKKSDLDLPDGSLNLISEIIFLSDDEYFILEDDNMGNVTFLEDETYNYRLNDRASFEFEIDELLAYDDGSAELGAGINKRNGRIAVRYELATSDTLTHIDIYFPNVGELPDNPRFNLSITTDLSDSDSSVYTLQEFSKKDTSKINGFTSYQFVNPVILSGEFYVVFEQFSDQFFPIGLDVNSKNGDKIYVSLTDQWEPNNILETDGSLMIRPRFGKYEFILNNKEEVTNSISVYPNPANNFLKIEGRFDQYQIIDLSGKVIQNGTERNIATDQILNGLYLLKVYGTDNVFTRKVVIQH